MITLGSLFDGSGGFPLAGAMNGAVPLWAAEVEPYPIAVTKSRFPKMKHLGNVSTVNGGEIEPVDIITFGSPCQDMSVAGKRAGMKHDEKGDEETTRSGLFYEAIRIIREMREKTHGRYPTFAVWENVPGAFSSQHGEDFLCVLKELAKIVAGGGTLIPRPSIGKWLNAGEIVGNGFSIAWRVFDAQYWGVPQRRKRIYLVADFRGERAGEILFERDSLQRNPAQSGAEREATAEDAHGCADGGGGVRCMNPWDSQSERIYDPDGVHPCLSANASGGQNRSGVVYALQGNGIDRADNAGCNGCGWREGAGYTLNTIDRHAVCFTNHSFGGYASGVGTLKANGGDYGGGSENLVVQKITDSILPGVCFAIDPLSSNSMKSKNPNSGFHEANHARCLDTSDQNPSKNQGGNVIVQACSPKVFHTITANNARNPESAQQPNCVAYQVKENGGQSLNIINPVCYQCAGFCPEESAKTRGVGYEEGQSPTLRSGAVPGVVYDARGNGDGSICPTLTGDHENRVTDYTAIAIGNGQLNQISMAQQCNTLDCMHDKQAIITKGKPPRKYIVRRLTPLECCRLQGFPDGWGVPDRKEDMTDEEYAFWLDVRMTHAIMGKKSNSERVYSKTQICKWYNSLHTDSAEYKMWGNGIALPNAYYVLGGCVEALKE